jgi:hypothetical protein
VASSIQFGYLVGNPDIRNKGDEAIVKLYKFKAKTDKRQIESDELTLVAKKSYIFKTENVTGYLTIPLLHPTTKEPVKLEDKTEYFASVEYIPRNNSYHELLIYANDTMYYEANYQATKSLGQPRRSSALQKGDEKHFSLDCFDYPMTPVIRLNVRSTVKEKNVLEDITIRVFPNPATSELNIESPNQDITSLKLQNILGQTVLAQDFANTINVSQLPNGIYHLILENDNQLIVKKICIEK